MAQILAGDIRKGVTFEYKSGVYTVTDFQHVKPGKGAAFVRATLKNVVTGQVLSNETFNPTTKLETAQVETKKMTYSYYDGEFYVFMDEEYNQEMLSFDQVEDALKYIKENDMVTVKFLYGKAFSCNTTTLYTVIGDIWLYLCICSAIAIGAYGIYKKVKAGKNNEN